MRSILRGALSLTLLLGSATACSDDDDPSAGSDETTSSTTSSSSTTSTTEATSTTAPGPIDDCPQRPDGSSLATFDESTGTYAVQELVVDAGAPSVTFDVVQWLSGDEAKEAFVEDFPDEPDGPPNDYYIVNENEQVRTAPVGDAAVIRVTHLSSDSSPAVEPETVGGLASYTGDGIGASSTYWLTFEDGDVVEVCEQYVP